MNWYYVSNNEQKGPIEDSEFDRLIQQGTIIGTTLVWREGLPNWQPYSEIGARSASASSSAGGAGGVVCSECGQAFAPDQVIRLNNRYVCAGCKPIVVQKMREGVTNRGAEQVRKDYIQHEASVKSVGILYFLGASFFLLASLGMFKSSARGVSNAGVGVLFLGLGAVQIWTGLGLRRLQPWARVPSGILSGLGLLGFPIGTLINGYILYLLFSKKGTMVFSEDYKRIIEETPHIKYRTSIVVWICLGLLLLLIGVGLIAVYFAPRR
jgi:hypothetical protein